MNSALITNRTDNKLHCTRPYSDKMDGTMMMEEDMMNMDMGNMDMGDGVDGSLMHDHSNSTGGYGFCTGGMGMVM